MSKYSPLQTYLASLPAGTNDKTLTFAQIERIIDAKLPPSAHEHRPWWANEVEGTHSHARSWLNAGWKVDTVNLSAQWVRFKKA
jgi:hypothetical protein